MRKILIVAVFAFLSAGCATTTSPQGGQSSAMQVRLGELERELQMKDDEIQDLKYQMKDLTYEIDRMKTKLPAATSMAGERRPSAGSAMVSSPDSSEGDIVRVEAPIEKVQQALKSAGYYDGKIDGKIGAMTKKAISSFQKDNGLNPDGIVGRKTWLALKTYLE